MQQHGESQNCHTVGKQTDTNAHCTTPFAQILENENYSMVTESRSVLPRAEGDGRE